MIKLIYQVPLSESPSSRIAKDNIYTIEKLYNEGNSISKIAKILQMNRKYLAKLFDLNNIQRRQRTAYGRKHTINEHYFDSIDTEEKAYMLGFIYADGNNLFKLNRISIKLAKVDDEILEKFSLIMYGKINLKYSKKKNNIGKEFEYVSFEMFNKHLSKQMASLGVVERKSHKITFPAWLSKDLYSHFLRGLIDGDGWIYLPNTKNKYRDSPCVGLICTRQINNFIKEYIQNELGIKAYLNKAYKQDMNIMCEIRVKNYHRCKIFLDWLYKDATIYLKRKYDLYQEFLCKYSKLREQNK